MSATRYEIEMLAIELFKQAYYKAGESWWSYKYRAAYRIRAAELLAEPIDRDTVGL